MANQQGQNGNQTRMTNAATPGVDSGNTAGTRSIDQTQVQQGKDLNNMDQDVAARNQEVVADNANRTGPGETSTRDDIATDIATDDQ